MTHRPNMKLLISSATLVTATLLPASLLAESELEFSYSDEWSVVSAPPPSGPYRAVHIDPRVPGPGITPPVTATFGAASEPGPETDSLAVTPVTPEAPGSDHSRSLTASEAVPGDSREIPTGSNLAEEKDSSAQVVRPEGVELEVPESLTLPPATGLAETEAPVQETPAAADIPLEQPAAPAPVLASPAEPAETTPKQIPALAKPAAAPELPPVPGHYQPAAPSIAEGDADVPGTAAMQAPIPTDAPPVAERVPEPRMPVPALNKGMVPPPAPSVAGSAPDSRAPAPGMGGMMPPASPGQYRPVMPPVAGDESRVPGLTRGAMPPPAAGMQPDASRAAPQEQPRAQDYYGRTVPPQTGYGYPGNQWQPGWSGRPQYGNMPPYGYYRAPTDARGQEVPPPGAYPPPGYGAGYPGR